MSTTDYTLAYTFWDVDTNQEILRIDNINVVPDDYDNWQRLLIIDDGTVAIVPTDPAKMVDAACAQAQRNLSWEEWVRVRPNDLYVPTCPGRLIPPDVVAASRQAGR